MIDLYRLLGIKRGATKEEVRKAYRRKAKVTHPDRGGSAEAFSALTMAHEVLSDVRRREKYDTTGEIEPAKPNNFDGSAVEVIAQKLGLIIHAEHELTELDIGALIEQAIREDIARRQASITEQSRAIERAAKLRARVRRKAEGADNMLARVLDWHERSSQGPHQEERGGRLLDGAGARDPRRLSLHRRPAGRGRDARIKWRLPCAIRSPPWTSSRPSSAPSRNRRLWGEH